MICRGAVSGDGDLRTDSRSLPTVDNLYALGALLDVPMEEILVAKKPQLNIVHTGQQDGTCCPSFLPE